jgi:hypothetical protein
MKLKCVYKNNKFPKKEYVCYQDVWENNSAFYVHENMDGNDGQKLEMSKTQYESFELILRTNGWSQAA